MAGRRRSSDIYPRRAPTRPRRRSAAPPTSSAGTRARAGWTRSSPGARGAELAGGRTPALHRCDTRRSRGRRPARDRGRLARERHRQLGRLRVTLRGRGRRSGSDAARPDHTRGRGRDRTVSSTSSAVAARLSSRPTARIVAVDLARGRSAKPARSPRPAPISPPSRSGIDPARRRARAAGTVSGLSELRPVEVALTAEPTRTRPAPTINVYAHDGPNMLTGGGEAARPLDLRPQQPEQHRRRDRPAHLQVVEHFAVGALPQHVVPAWNLKTLYVTNDAGNSLTPIDPRTGKPGPSIPVDDPYNMYFTPDGRYAIVVAERLRPPRLPQPAHLRAPPLAERALPRCRPHGLLRRRQLPDRELRVLGQSSSRSTSPPSASSRTLDAARRARGDAPGRQALARTARIFYVADMHAGGVWEIDGAAYA